MHILGISAFSHESSACLLKDGIPIALAEEERFNREKHTSRFPENAVRAVLKIGKTSLTELNAVTFFWQPWREIRENLAHFLRYLPGSVNLLRSPIGSERLTFRERFRLQATLRSQFKQHNLALDRSTPIHSIEHHLAHAASCFFVSPFEEAAILTIDGRGERASTLWATGKGNRIAKLQEQYTPHSLGHLYAAVTEYLGFKAFHDEWKVMGLSAYGTPALSKDFKEIVVLKPEGRYELNLKFFRFHTCGRLQWISGEFIRRFGPPRRPEDQYDQRFMDIAYALQKNVEQAALHMARTLYQRTHQTRLCLAGGVALNCLMNKVLLEKGPFQDIFIQPIAHDAGTSLGSALYHYHQNLGFPRKHVFENIYLGPEYSENEIRKAIAKKGLQGHQSPSAAREAVQAIADGRIVGWFQGRMEAGPRALGNRSLLADPRRREMRDILNTRIKRREWFRPFAPSVAVEAAKDFFCLRQESPFMILAADVLEHKKKLIPAVVHKDGTARVQTVSKEQNPLFWELLHEFGKLTGMPLLLNTSLNENEPIVCTPEQALDCFLRTGMDMLVLDRFIVEKAA